MPGKYLRIMQSMRIGGRVTIWRGAWRLRSPASPRRRWPRRKPPQTSTRRRRRPPPTPSGPEQLRDFSLPGTVTRRTDPAAGHDDQHNDQRRQPEAQPSNAAPLAVRTRPVVSTAPSRSVTVALPAPDPLAQRPTLAPPVDETSMTLGAQPVVEPNPAAAAGEPSGRDSGGSWLPWLFALLLVAGAGALFVWRQRSAARPAYAGAARGRTGRDPGGGASAPRRAWHSPRRRPALARARAAAIRRDRIGTG